MKMSNNKLEAVGHAIISNLRELRQEDQKFQVSLEIFHKTKQ